MIHPKQEWIEAKALERDETLVLACGFESAILGVADIQGHSVVIYSRDRILNSLMLDGLEYEEAVEHFEFNIAGAYVGPQTPVYVEEYSAEDRGTT